MFANLFKQVGNDEVTATNVQTNFPIPIFMIWVKCLIIIVNKLGWVLRTMSTYIRERRMKVRNSIV